MKRLWVYNYDFEFRLAGQPPLKAGSGPWALLNRSGQWMAPLCQPGDGILLPEPPPPWISQSLEGLLGFCPEWVIRPREPETNAPLADWAMVLLELAQAWSIRYWGQPQPNALMRRVNSKAFSYQAREQLLPPAWHIPSAWLEGAGLTRQRLDETLSQFEAEQGSFLVKDPFGLSGRGLAFNPGPAEYSRLLGWAQASGGLLLEKVLAHQGEESLHFDIHDQGYQYCGRAKLFSNPQGGYSGSQVQPEEAPPWLDEVFPLLALVQDAGYRGPLGLDLLYDAEFQPRLLEVNARWTMGRMALEWARRLGFAGILALKRDSVSASQPLEALTPPPGTHFIHYAAGGKAWLTRLILARNPIDLVWQEQAFKAKLYQ